LVAEVNGTMFSIPAPKVKVKDPTGSGDVASAALVYEEFFNWPMERTFQRAVLSGTLHAKIETQQKALNYNMLRINR
jgi:sugar/nucleoside kinase (ribokinase family)